MGRGTQTVLPPLAAARAENAPEGGSRQALRASPGATELRFPERSWREWLWALAVFAATGLAYIPFLRSESFSLDEGILLRGAERILHGQVLYRDFFGFYTPGSYYGLALLFHWFGDSILTGRIALLLEGAAMAALTYLIARRVAARWAAGLAAYAMAVMALPYFFITLHNWDSTLLAYLALYAAVLWLQKPRAGLAAAIGFFAALTCLDEQSKGAGLVLGLVLAGLWLALAAEPPRRREWRERLRRQWQWMAAGFAAPVAATAGYFAAHGALGDLVTDCLWPLRHYGAANAVPYGYMLIGPEAPRQGPWTAKALAWLRFSPHIALLILPWAAVGVAVFLWLGRRPGRPEGLTRAYYAVASCVMAGLLLSVLASRRDYTHVVFLTPVFALVIAWASGRPAPGRVARMAAPAIAVYVLLFFALAGMTYWARAIWGYPHEIITAHGRLRAAAAGPLLAQLRRLPPGPIFVYPYLPIYYYLSGRENPTRYEWLQYGMNGAEQFAAAEQELKASPPVAVLWNTNYARLEAKVFPGTPAAAVARLYPLGQYLLLHYHRCAEFSQIPYRLVLMRRRGENCRYLDTGDQDWARRERSQASKAGER